MGRHLSLFIRTSAVTLVVSALALAAAACGSDDTTESGSSSGSSGSSGTSGASGGTGKVVYEDSGTSNCTTGPSTCEGALCKCAEGANKDKVCQKTDKAQPKYCDSLCEVCK
jgi:hypothetical protein